MLRNQKTALNCLCVSRARLLERLATIAEPFSLYAAMIPGEHNRRVDFWIKITGKPV